MADVSGNYRTGWTIKFTKKESGTIADATNAAGVAAGVIPDPILSKIVAAGLSLAGIALRRGIRQGYKLKVKVKMHSVPSSWPPSPIELYEFVSGPLQPRIKPALY